MRIVPELLKAYCFLVKNCGYENNLDAFAKWQTKQLGYGKNQYCINKKWGK